MRKNKIKKIAKYAFYTVGIFMLIMVLLGHTDLGNLPKNYKSKNQFITVGNEKVRVIQKGYGKDILLVHGTPGSIEDWNEIIDNLSENYRVTAFDRLGHGFSSANKYTYHLEDNANFIENLIEKLNIKSLLVIGHSYGGSIAAFMAVNSTYEGIKYIIIDSPLYKCCPSNKLYKLTSTPIFGKGISLLSSYTIAKKYIKIRFSSLFKSLKKEKIDELLKERQLIWSQPKVIYSNSKEYMNYLDNLNSISEKYKNITSHITLVTVKDSINTFRNDAERFKEEVPHCNLITLEGTGHFIQLEKPQDIIRIITNNIKQTDTNTL